MSSVLDIKTFPAMLKEGGMGAEEQELSVWIVSTSMFFLVLGLLLTFLAADGSRSVNGQ